MNLEELFEEVYVTSHFEENEAAFFNEIYNLSHLEEISAARFADTFRKYVFSKTSKESDNAGLNAMDKMVNQLHNTKYQRTDIRGKTKINGDVENILRVKAPPLTRTYNLIMATIVTRLIFKKSFPKKNGKNCQKSLRLEIHQKFYVIDI